MGTELLGEFCIRLASGLACMIPCLSPRAVAAQLFRTIALVVLALSVFAILARTGQGPSSVVLGLAAAFSFVSSALWTLGRAQAAWRISLGAAMCMLVALVWTQLSIPSLDPWNCLRQIAVSFSSSLLLGSMMAAMLLGHSYLVAPTMSIDPLRRLVWLIAGSVAVRTVVAGAGVAAWLYTRASQAAASTIPDAMEWSLLSGRWLIGLIGPAVISYMVWQTAKLRSTQSATGILYVGVILTFFGELAGAMLAGRFPYVS